MWPVRSVDQRKSVRGSRPLSTTRAHVTTAERLGEMGRGASGFREFVRGLPDDIARQREAGLPISFPASALPADPGRRASTVALMGALGVAIVEEQPVSLSAHDLLRVRDCAAPNCANEAVAGDHLCSEHVAFRIEREATLQAERDRRRAERLARPGVCKIDGCDEVANTRYDRGTFARLCDSHIETARRREQEAQPRATPLSYEREPAAVEAPPMLERIPPALDHAAAAARSSLSPEIRAALADLLNAIAKELRAA